MDNLDPLGQSRPRLWNNPFGKFPFNNKGFAGEGGEGDEGDEGGQGDKGKEKAPAPTDWKAGLPEEIRSHPSMSNFKSVEDLGKSWVNAQKLIGADKLVLPGKDAKPEEWATVFDKLGRPKEAKEYAITEPENMPKELKDEEQREAFKAEAHKLGLLPDQVQGLYQWFVGQQMKILEDMASEQQESQGAAEATLRKEWAKSYDSNINLAKKVFNQFGDKKDAAWFQEHGNDPALLRLFAKVGKVMSDDNLIKGPVGEALSPQEAQVEINKIMSDPKHPYNVKDHKEHDLAVQRVADLHTMAYPEKQE